MRRETIPVTTADSGRTPAQAPRRRSGPASVMALQRSIGNRAARRLLARDVTYDDCSTDQQDAIGAAHTRGLELIRNAIAKLDSYDGTDPAEVKRSLQRNFGSSSTTVAWIVQNNLENLLPQVDPQYECHTEANGSAEAEAMWCIPWSDIKVYPLFYNRSDGTATTNDYRASTLVHEWFHRYLCKFDLGYEWEDDYPSHSTLRQLANADSYSTFVYEVR